MTAIENLREVLIILEERIDNPNATKYVTSDLKECYNTISQSIDELEKTINIQNRIINLNVPKSPITRSWVDISRALGWGIFYGAVVILYVSIFIIMYRVEKVIEIISK